MLDVTGAEIRIPQKPSEVFLELWQWSAMDLTPEQFTECAEAWRQIVSLEEIYAAAEQQQKEQRQKMKELLHWGEDPQPIRELRSDEGIAPYADSPAPAEGPVAVTYDCASAPMPDPEEAEKAAAARSDAGKASMITRKRRALERLEAQRGAGVTLAEIAGAAKGLTLSDVMDFLDRKPVPLPKLAALEKALNKLEEANSGGD